MLLVSAKKEEIDKIKGFTLGADDYITKPFSPGELVARVKSHIKNYERIKNKFNCKHNKLTIRGLEILRDSRQVFVNGKEITLAQKNLTFCFIWQKTLIEYLIEKSSLKNMGSWFNGG